MNFLSDSLIIRIDESTKNLLILHPDAVKYPSPLITIRHETYMTMSFKELAEFLGARVILLSPLMREHFKEHVERLASSENGAL